MTLSDFDFELPPELIATHPLSERDASRMLVVNVPPSLGGCAPLKEGGTSDCPNFIDAHIRDFLDYLQPGDVVVFNNSKVIPARFDAVDATGRVHEITLHTAAGDVPLQWYGLCLKFNKLKIGDELTVYDSAVGARWTHPAQSSIAPGPGGNAPNDASEQRARCHAPLQVAKIKILGKDDDSGLLIEFLCDPSPDGAEAGVFDVLDRVGKMPLPPYMKRADEPADRERYQTVYANPLGSMAAPTAGLHFTPELLREIESRGATIVNITLHVGAGTWMPVKSEDLSQHKMHGEWGCITPAQVDIINAAKRVIAVGTTSLRLLESASLRSKSEERRAQVSSKIKVKCPDTNNSELITFDSPALCALRSSTLCAQRIKPFCGTTDIFITPGYEFRAVDVLLTNFHLPKSTLFMLVSAFAGVPEMRAAYAHAILEKYRFFSYGDCCLLFKKEFRDAI